MSETELINKDTHILKENLNKYSTFNTKYNKEKKNLFDRFRYILHNKIFEYEYFDLAKQIIRVSSDYYSAFIYIKLLLDKEIIKYNEVYDFLNDIIADNLKSFQIWFFNKGP